MAKDTIRVPKGDAVYPSLAKPDTRFDELGTYKADVRLPRKRGDVVKFLGELEAEYKAWVGKPHPRNPEKDNKNAVYYVERDEDGNMTDFIVVKMRAKNKLNKKGELWDRRPAQFDAKARPIAKPLSVGGGSEIKVTAEIYRGQPRSGTKFLTLQPLAVQVIKLVEFGGVRDASDYGFEAEEDGFEVDETTADDDYATDASGDEDDDSGDY